MLKRIAAITFIFFCTTFVSAERSVQQDVPLPLAPEHSDVQLEHRQKGLLGFRVVHIVFGAVIAGRYRG
jgi:hypothetical protein